MALINCPECNKEISDRVQACPNCGFPLSENEEIVPQESQKVELTGVKIKNKKTKTILLIVLIFVVLGIILTVGIKIFDNVSSKNNYQQTYNTYIDNLTSVKTTMLVSGSQAETMCNLTLKVWQNAIYKESDIETDKYVRKGGYWASDFNVALKNLFDDSAIKSEVSTMNSNKESVKTKMKELQNPPEGLEKCYETVTELYTAYQGLVDLACNPAGNYSAYSSSKTTKVTSFMDQYEKLTLQIPDKTIAD